MRNLKPTIKNIAIAGAFATSCLSTPTFALAIFGINEGSVPGTPANIFNADRLNGSYTEIFTTTAVGTFSTVAYFALGSYTLNSGGAVISYLNNPEPAGYAEYAVVTSSGTFAMSGTVLTIDATSNTIQLYIDPNSDTTATLPETGAGSITRTSFADDLRILSAFNGIGVASGDSTKLNTGNLSTLFNGLALDPAGELYFSSPSPFYIDLQANGNFNPSPPPVGDNMLQQGVANIFFFKNTVPEPSSVALLGIGLLGIAATKKRRRNAR